MSTANVVPETWGLDSADARQVLKDAGFAPVLKESVVRLRFADGFSHGRALAFQTVLALIPGVVVTLGIAGLTNSDSLRGSVLDLLSAMVPGPAHEVLREAAQHGASQGARHGVGALVVGGLAMLVAGATAFGQIERGANRIYGVEQDRPTLHKYARATALAASAGLLMLLSFVALAAGRSVAGTITSPVWRDIWRAGRWPLGVLVLVLAYTVVFQVCPKRRQPSFSWLAVGALLSVALTFAISVLLSVYLNASSSLGQTYGPLAGFIGIMLWANLAAIALYLGLAFAAQLEAVRAGRARPQSSEKVETTEPASQGAAVSATASVAVRPASGSSW